MGPYLSTPKTEKRTLTGESPRMRFATSDMQGWRVTMEDARIAKLDLDANTAFFGVYDGHGGPEVAEFVTRHLPQELAQSQAYREGRLDDALRQSYLRMDELQQTPDGIRELIRISRDLPETAAVNVNDNTVQAGCTAVSALIRGNEIYVANAGDSRCVLSRGGLAVELSMDHKPDLPEELERIRRAGGTVEEGRVMGNLNLSRSIGDLEYKKNNSIPQRDQMITAFPDIRRETLQPNDEFIILACDGVWDMLTSQQCVDFVRQRIGVKSLSVIVEEMLDRCLSPEIGANAGLGCDNMTAIIVQFKHPLN
ncbi:unnamed protein product [Blepharisma stoltei]|uniref:PPM-type phosphatase domain-containing protein n=1 Tax=Blepharisma stoltei TaxID=1481888 RepID=A0AAU9JIM7_9CILI|nr:unnamed protein product [Blepharisma stoltei]